VKRSGLLRARPAGPSSSDDRCARAISAALACEPVTRAPLRARADLARGYDESIGQSSLFVDTLRSARELAGSRAAVLLVGEVGTGKSFVARAIQRASHQSPGPFVRLRCDARPSFEAELFGAEPDGRASSASAWRGAATAAQGGVLLLEAIDRLPLALQRKVLRLLAERTFQRVGARESVVSSARVVLTTERELALFVDEGRFRTDLFRRLSVATIQLPALREQPAHIVPLAQRLLRHAARVSGSAVRAFEPSSVALLESYAWPGNVRELKRVIDGLVAHAEGALLALPLGAAARRRPVPQRLDDLADLDRAQILEALRYASGTLAGPNGAAARLGMTVGTLCFRMKRLGIATVRR
jgi:DNA-binding NtrC family response regulator